MSIIPTKDELKEFFGSYNDLFRLPISLEQDYDMYSILNERWKAVLEVAEKTIWLQNTVPYVKESITRINEAISEFYSGNTLNAIGAIS